MNKKNKEKKIILWEGFRKELPWILFWILLGIMAYGYYQDKQICDEVLANPCDACYKLNQTLENPMTALSNQELIDKNIIEYPDLKINDSFLKYEDKNPNDRTIENYR